MESENHIPESELSELSESKTPDVFREVLGSTDIPQEIQENLLNPDNWDNEKGNIEKEYEKFLSYISLNQATKNQIIQTLVNIPEDKLGDYIYENGFIINNDTKQVFLHTFGGKSEDIVRENTTEAVAIATAAEQEADIKQQITTLEIKETNELKTKTEEFLSHFEDKQATLGNIGGLGDIISDARGALNASENTEGQFEKIHQRILAFFQNLEGNKESFAQVAQTFYEEGPQAYEEYKSYALSVNPNLAPQFQEFTPARPDAISVQSDLAQAQIIAGLGTSDPRAIEQYGSIVESTNDGQTTRIDLGNEPPTRTIGLEGSSLRLDSDLPIGDFYPAISEQGLAYEKTSAENMPKISVLKALQSSVVQDFLQSDDFKDPGMTSGNALLHISNMIGLGNNPEMLKNILGLSGNVTKEDILRRVGNTGSLVEAQKMLEKEIQNKKTAYQEALKTHMQDYKTQLRERDDIAQKALHVCKNAGLDMLDISYILSQLSGSKKPDIGLSFYEKNIDIATLNFGQSSTESGELSRFTEYVYRTINKIAFGNPEGKMNEKGENMGFDLQAVRNNPEGQYKTSLEISTMLKNTGVINRNTGMMNRDIVMQRLTGKIEYSKNI